MDSFGFENFDGMSPLTKVKSDFRIDNTTNIDSPINCERPSIIFNPNWFEEMFSHPYIVLADQVLSTHQFMTYNRKYLENYIRTTYCPTMDNYESFCILNGDHRPIPIFYLVPCGHCHCCIQSKTNEYAFRSVCETAVHDNPPLFLTLTYRPGCVPEDGVRVDDLQRFLKRLRFRLYDLGIDCNLRYLAVSEYGCKSGLPHYHIILWGYPIDHEIFKNNLSLAYRPIYQSWKYYMLFNGHRRYHYNKKTKKRRAAMRSLGIIKILPVTNGCTSYITKYFRKEDHNKNRYPNKTFLLSSRRNGGIGSNWIRSKFQEVIDNRDNPRYKLSVFNKLTQKVVSHSVSGYLKNMLFKSKSSVLPKKQYDIVRELVDKIQYFQALHYFRNRDSDICEFFPGLKRLRRFLPNVNRLYFKVKFRHLRHLNYIELTRLGRDILIRIKDLWFQLDKKLLAKANQLLDLREIFFRSRQDLPDRRLHVNLQASFSKHNYNYVKYKTNCTF